MSLFAFEHVTKHHWDGRRPFTVLDDVSFEVDAGDFVGIGVCDAREVNPVAPRGRDRTAG